MKITFLLLALANGCLFLWQAYLVVPDKPVRVQLPANVPQLVLLEETGTTAPRVIDVATATPATPETETIEPTEPRIILDDDLVDSELIDAGFTDAAANAEFLNNQVPLTPPENEPTPKNCYTVGPFVDEAVLKKARQLFDDNGIRYRQRILSKSEVFGYNVFLAPFPSRQQAQAMVNVLLDKGIKDYYVMRESSLANAISLGVFSEQRFALSHMDFLKSKGLSPKIRIRYTQRNRHWLDYAETGSIIDKATLVQLSPEEGIQRLVRACG